jgi:hypothetical protein
MGEENNQYITSRPYRPVLHSKAKLQPGFSIIFVFLISNLCLPLTVFLEPFYLSLIELGSRQTQSW